MLWKKYGKIYAVGFDLVEDKEVAIDTISKSKDSKWEISDEKKILSDTKEGVDR